MSRTQSAALLLGPFAIALLFSFFRLSAYAFHVPDDGDYAFLRAALTEAQFDPAHDAITVQPAWSLRAWQAIGDYRPISGDGLERRPLHRWRRLFVVVEPDAPSRDALGKPFLTRSSGRVALERYELSLPPVTYDFTRHVEDAEIHIDSPQGVVACDAPARGGKSCRGRGGWQRVTRQWLLVSENGDEAVWSHPPPPGSSLAITFSDVTLGNSIVFRAGHTREGADQAQGDVTLHVLVDGAEVGAIKRSPRFDFAPKIVSTQGYSGEHHEVRFVVDTAREANQHFAWDAYAIGDAR